MNINDDVGGGGVDDDDADDDNDAEEKRWWHLKRRRRDMIPRYTTLTVKKTSLNSWRISNREEKYKCNGRTCPVLLTVSNMFRLYKQAINKRKKNKDLIYLSYSMRIREYEAFGYKEY
jgi:hypothetical protein